MSPRFKINRIFDTTGKPGVIEIAIWGPPQSGKTNYIAMLILSKRPDGWALRVEDETADFLSKGIEFIQKKEFIPATPVEEGVFYPFEFEVPGSYRKNIYTVYLPEYPGEYYENPNKYSEFAKRIARCDGVIWLVDPVEISDPTEGRKSYTRMILEWLGILKKYQGGTRIKSHMVFCLSKMDHPDHVKGLANPGEYCFKLLGRHVQQFLEDFCDPRKVEFSAISAAGLIPGTKISNVNPNNPRELLNDPNPINLFGPFHWLFDVI